MWDYSHWEEGPRDSGRHTPHPAIFRALKWDSSLNRGPGICTFYQSHSSYGPANHLGFILNLQGSLTNQSCVKYLFWESIHSSVWHQVSVFFFFHQEITDVHCLNCPAAKEGKGSSPACWQQCWADYPLPDVCTFWSPYHQMITKSSLSCFWNMIISISSIYILSIYLIISLYITIMVCTTSPGPGNCQTCILSKSFLAPLPCIFLPVSKLNVFGDRG